MRHTVYTLNNKVELYFKTLHLLGVKISDLGWEQVSKTHLDMRQMVPEVTGRAYRAPTPHSICKQRDGDSCLCFRLADDL